MTLPDKPFEAPKENLLKKLFKNVRASRERTRDKKALRGLLLEAVSDGVLTSEELESIRAFLRENQLHEVEMQEWSQEIFKKAVDSLSPAYLSSDRIGAIENIKTKLCIPENKVFNELERLNRYRTIARIREGNLPPIHAENVFLRAGESVFWVQPAQLWESRVVGRRYEGGSAGMSFRIAKGITLRTGATRGTLVTNTADVPICEGNFIITSRRFIFQGQTKSFETKYEKIISIENHLDGIRYSESNRQKPRQLGYLAPNGDIIVEILNRVFSGDTGI